MRSALQEDQPVSVLRFRVYKKDMIGSSFLGETYFAVEELLDGVPRDNWYTLRNKKGKLDKKGDLRVQVLYLTSEVRER